MPEPEEAADVVVPPTPPMEATSSRASFASCPPEEDRDAHAPRQSREEATSLTQSAANGDTMDDGRESVRQEPTPEPEVHLGAEREKGEHVEDARIGVEEREASSAPSPEVQGESEVRSTQPVGSEEARGREEDNAPLYLSYPPIRRDRVGHDDDERGSTEIKRADTSYS